MTTRTWLITGGCGFIGANLVRHVLARHDDVRVINVDLLTYSGNPENLAEVDTDPRYEFHKCDIADANRVSPLLERAQVVFHLAAESHVDRSIVDATPFTRTNVLGTQSLLDAVRRQQDRSGRSIRFVHVSTDEVYGSLPLDRPDLRFAEDAPLAPSSPYAASKAGGDLLAQAYHRTFGMDTITTRCANNFGPYQLPEKVIPLFVTRLLTGGRVPLYGDGLNVRDWLHVDDHCEALVAIAARARPGSVYNIGGNNERSNIELTRALIDLCGRDESAIEHVPDRPGHDRRYAVDGSKLERELGWSPTRSAWPQALEQTVAWYRENRGWCERAEARLFAAPRAGPGTSGWAQK